MIIIFGGTTEGRRTAEVLDEAGSPYFYSTRTSGQPLTLQHGVQLTGDMDLTAMKRFVREHDVRLIVDAAHPFARQLHRHLLLLAREAAVPVVRYDRLYPPRPADVTWCADYADAISRMEAAGVTRLLALTGVNTISSLRPFWHDAAGDGTPRQCWFRILDRDDSRRVASKAGFPPERLVYYDAEGTPALLSRLRPQAILTKESGVSGGFTEKVEAARSASVRVFAVERPPYPPADVPADTAMPVTVNGPHGLRRAVERLLPDFFPLHSGLTTGTCATAAAVAQALRLFRGETPAEVPVVLPDGETIYVPVSYGDGYASATKEAGDDPDVTDGLEIRAAIALLAPPAQQPPAGGTITIVGGKGVGTFTLPGFDYPPGEAAINRVPRQMIGQNLSALCLPVSQSLSVSISVPEGEAVAHRTFNPRLGIEGGISIIGVSGIVKPFSEEAFVESIRKCMAVAKASGAPRVVINSGAKSERYLRAYYPTLPRQAFVEYGNYIGATLTMADALGMADVTLGIMLGKAIKLAAGHLDTHSRRTTMDKAFMASLLAEANCHADLSRLTLARELWTLLPPDSLQTFARVVIGHCRRHCAPLLPKGRLVILLIDDNGHLYHG